MASRITPDPENADGSTKPARPKRPNYAKIHEKPLPLEVYPLPTFQPHNPLTLVKIAWVVVSHYLFPPSSHLKQRYQAYFSPETRSVHVVEPASIRALWEHGFYGKGSLSRSEPNWLVQETKQRGLAEGVTSEEVTNERRRERIEMKKERARKEQEMLKTLLDQESGAPAPELRGSDVQESGGAPESRPQTASTDDMFPNWSLGGMPQPSKAEIDPNGTSEGDSVEKSLDPPPTEQVDIVQRVSEDVAFTEAIPEAPLTTEIKNEEHLQLSLEEAFFLVYGLGVLDIEFSGSPSPPDPRRLLELFRRYSYFPPAPMSALRPDDPFLVNYVAFHHFRSLGWVIRPGNKFAVDYLLYKGGPVFSHAEFAVILVPSYTHSYWSEIPERMMSAERRRREKEWWWIHSVNRIQAQVLKTLVLAYIDIPPPLEVFKDKADALDIGGMLGRYKIREVVVRRWTPNRWRE